jgi:PAS domain S-box-containing protein
VAKQDITVELDDETIRNLAVLGNPVEVLARLAHSAADVVLHPGHLQRDQTDESLRVERDRSDAAIVKKRLAVEVVADEVVRIARQRADQVVRTARDDVDGERRPQSTAGQTSSERERADVLLEDERSTADTVLRDERAEHRVERDRSSARVEEKRDAGEKEADEVVRTARRRADQVVRTARDDADRERHPWSTASETSSERERSDVLLESERSNADSVLGDERAERRVERDRTSVGAAEKREASEKEVDEAVRIARQRADELVRTARQGADRERLSLSTATSERERTRADDLLEGERSNADALLEHERSEQRRHSGVSLTAEREATDKDLGDERSQADTALVDQREANAQMVSATIRAQELAEVAEERRNRASVALERSSQQFRRLVESVGDYAIFMLDPSGIITTWNLGAERIKGYKADEIIGEHFSRFYGEEDVLAGMCERELETATRVGRVEAQGWRVRKDGSRFWAKVVISAIRNRDGTLDGFAKVTRDLTSERAAEEEQLELARSRESERDLRAVAEFRELFIGILGHDLRNPLSSIVGSAALLLRRGHFNEQDAATVARIIRSSQRMTKMITQLLDLTRARLGGGLPIAPEPTDLREVCQNVVEEFEAPIQLEVEGDVTGTWDPDRLEEALSNLAGNAVQYSARGTVVIVKAHADGAEVVVEVSNQGDPIAADVLPFIFEPFRRATSKQSASGNLGLGLYIANQIVLSHRGTLDARSAGGTTTFVIRLPRESRSPRL